MMKLHEVVMKCPAKGLIGLIRLYQLALSPFFAPRCNFYPSCSQYGIDALRQHGILKGTILLAWRILRCNPWNCGGVDHIPHKGCWRPPVWIPPDDWDTADTDIPYVMGLDVTSRVSGI